MSNDCWPRGEIATRTFCRSPAASPSPEAGAPRHRHARPQIQDETREAGSAHADRATPTAPVRPDPDRHGRLSAAATARLKPAAADSIAQPNPRARLQRTDPRHTGEHEGPILMRVMFRPRPGIDAMPPRSTGPARPARRAATRPRRLRRCLRRAVGASRTESPRRIVLRQCRGSPLTPTKVTSSGNNRRMTVCSARPARVALHAVARSTSCCAPPPRPPGRPTSARGRRQRRRVRRPPRLCLLHQRFDFP
jgi:hypothetical protein